MNTFGTASLQFPLYDPRKVITNRARFRRDYNPMLARANSLYCPIGRYATRGWLLLARSDYNRLDQYSTSLQLNLGDTSSASNVAMLKNLSIVQAQCVTRGLANDSNALYLVEVTDARGILANKWFQFPTTSFYNIRAPAYPQTFQPLSLNGGTTWTWTTMLQDLWQQMPLLGAWPGLPSAPLGTPEGFWMLGVPAYTALCEILDYLGLAVAADLTQTNPYTIVSTGGDDSAFTAKQAKYLPNLEDDYEWLDVGSGRVPKTVKVLFRRRNSIYGTEETVRYDSLQWDMNTVYTVSVAAPSTFASAVGIHYLWADFTVRSDEDGNVLAADTATATSIAAQRVTQYFDRIYSRTSGYMTQVYAGALPFAVGSQVDGVCWYQDYSSQTRQGWKTRITREYPPFPEIYK